MKTRSAAEISFRAAVGSALASPTMLSPNAVDAVRAAVGFRPRADAADGDGAMQTAPPFERVGNGVSVVRIDGPIAQRAWACWIFSGDGYDAIAKRVQAAMDDNRTTGVVLAIDSPGGQVAGCFEGARAIRASADAAGKPLVAFADETMNSGAYALGCAADAIVCPETGQIGSIGVIAVVSDNVAANALEGINARVVRSGKYKAAPHPDEPLTDAAVAQVQGAIDTMAGTFASWVSGRRGMSADDVMALEGAVFLGADAVQKKIADQVGNMAAAVSRAADMAKSKKYASRRAAGAKTMKTVLTALSLTDDATEADALAAVTKLQTTARDAAAANAAVLGALGVNTLDEASGAITGLKASAATVATMQAEAQKRERADLIAHGKAAGKLTPAMITHFEAQSNESLRGFLSVAPKVIDTVVASEPNGEAGMAKELAAMSPKEQARLYHEDRPRYDALKAAAEKLAAQ